MQTHTHVFLHQFLHKTLKKMIETLFCALTKMTVTVPVWKWRSLQTTYFTFSDTYIHIHIKHIKQRIKYGRIEASFAGKRPLNDLHALFAKQKRNSFVLPYEERDSERNSCHIFKRIHIGSLIHTYLHICICDIHLYVCILSNIYEFNSCLCIHVMVYNYLVSVDSKTPSSHPNLLACHWR